MPKHGKQEKKPRESKIKFQTTTIRLHPHDNLARRLQAEASRRLRREFFSGKFLP